MAHYNNQLETPPWEQVGAGIAATIYFKSVPSDIQFEKTVEYVKKQGGRMKPYPKYWSGPTDAMKDGIEAWFGPDERDVKAFISDMRHIPSFKSCDYVDVHIDPAGGVHWGDDGDPAAMYESQSSTGVPAFESMDREHLIEAVELRPVNVRLSDGSLKTISKTDEVSDDIVFESIEEIYPEGFDELSERVVLKRRYGKSPEVSMNSHGPLRNDVLEFVGNRFVTDGELNSFFNQLEEARGKKLNYRKWFNENQKFFESYTLKGTKVWSLSKVGKRAFEHIVELRSSNTINEKVVLEYSDFILSEDLTPSMILEGEIPAAESSKLKEVISANGFMALRDPLKKLGWKVDFSFSPVATYIITKGKLKVAILNKKYVDDAEPDQVVGDIAFGLMESVSADIKTPASVKTVQKVIELTLKSAKPSVTEDEVVKQLAAINDLESLYTAAVKLISPDQVNSFKKNFPVHESVLESSLNRDGLVLSLGVFSVDPKNGTIIGEETEVDVAKAVMPNMASDWLFSKDKFKYLAKQKSFFEKATAQFIRTLINLHKSKKYDLNSPSISYRINTYLNGSSIETPSEWDSKLYHGVSDAIN